MIGDKFLEAFKPKEGNLIEDFPFVGNGVRKHYVKCTQSIGGDNKEFVLALGINVADLPFGNAREGEVCFKDGFFCCAHGHAGEL